MRLRQLVVNVLHNAIKFTDQGTVSMDVGVIEETPDGLDVRFSVHDTGIGIAEDKIDSIFGAFTQVDGSSTRRHGGSGLGLTLVQELASLMGGHVRVESRLHEGSHFWVDLPLKPVAEPASPAQASQPCEPAPAAGAPGADEADAPLSVLLVEDDRVNQMLVEELLKMLGCEVDVADDGDVGHRAAATRRYDIVFMDCHMPVMDGYEATRRIRDEESRAGTRTTIVALTADSLPSDRARCIESGMDDFLTKPVSSAQLSATIQRWTGRRTQPALQW
jgi:CheY-like chemotaxis protein